MIYSGFIRVNNRHTSIQSARQIYEQAANSPRRDLCWFDEPEGGTEHNSIDKMPCVASHISDWV